MKITTLCVALLMLVGCSSGITEPETVYLTGGNAQPLILLQDVNTGDIVCCKDTADSTAEECARALESDCFVRVQDLPYRTAEYDFLTTNTYPTRRWREGETTPRW